MDKVCKICGLVFSGAPSTMKKRKYCSHACNARANFGFGVKNVVDNTDTVDNGEVFEKYGKPPLWDLPSWVDVDRVLMEVSKRGRAIIHDEAEAPIGEVGRDLVYKEY